MGIRNFPYITIGTGNGLITSSISLTASKIAIPAMSNLTLPKFLHCIALGGTAGNLVFIMPTNDTVGSAATGMVLSPDNPRSVILNVHGFSHIGTDATGTADSDLYLYPLEDF
jgi:hypothetical protein